MSNAQPSPAAAVGVQLTEALLKNDVAFWQAFNALFSMVLAAATILLLIVFKDVDFIDMALLAIAVGMQSAINMEYKDAARQLSEHRLARLIREGTTPIPPTSSSQS